MRNFFLRRMNDCQLFPKKTNNLQKCPLKISAIVNEPCVYDALLTTKLGSEYEMILGITNHLNIDPIFKFLNNSIAHPETT